MTFHLQKIKVYLKRIIVLSLLTSQNIILHNDIEEDSTIERIIEYVKNIQLKETEEKLFKLLNMRNSIKFNDDKDQLKIDNLQQTILTLLYEIIKLN